MPELPEVETTARMLNERVKGLVIKDVWTDYDSSFNKGKGNIKDKNYFPFFKKEVAGKRILNVTRRAKNVLINVSPINHGLKKNKTILIHMKMTGHLLYGKYKKEENKWFPIEEGSLKDPFNRFVHFVFILSNGKHLVLSDTRKFAKVYVFDTEKFKDIGDLSKLGPEPLEKKFDYKTFRERINLRPRGKIKTVLMDQEIIAGIGNIYSDEVLWETSIHPATLVKDIYDNKLKNLLKNIKATLQKSIEVGGDSMSDYRNPEGEKGGYQNIHKVYRRTGEKCQKKGCEGTIRKIKIGGRSAHYCDRHQILNK